MKLSNKKTIGILGGLGPAATLHFYELLIKKLNKEYKIIQDSDFPPTIIYSLPLSDWDETGIKDEESIKKQLIDGVKKLEVWGSDYIVISCNTVHHYFEVMQKSVYVPIINMVEKTVLELKKRSFKFVGILSSESTNRLNIYKNECLKQGIVPISANKEQQDKINNVIMNIMSGVNNGEDLEVLQDISKNLVLQGAQAIILGCTELPIVMNSRNFNKPVFSSSEIAVKNLLKIYYEV